MMKIHNVDQNTEDWMNLRLGRLGSSEASVLLVDGQSESGLGTGAITKLVHKISEQVTGQISSSDYQSLDMEKGNEYEPLARKAYENQFFTRIDQVGYISLDDFFGYSPDGLIGEDGLVEFKCLSGPEYVRYSMYRKIPAKYMGQMQWGLFVTQRKWIDYGVYNHDFRTKLLIEKVLPNKKTQDRFHKMKMIFEREMKKGIELMMR